MKKFPTEAVPAQTPGPAAPDPTPPVRRTKVVTQILLPLGILVVGVAGITFVAQYLPGWRKAPKKQDSFKGELLNFAEKKTNWDPLYRLDNPDRPEYVQEFEPETDGHYSFWFSNEQPGAVELGLQHKTCNCSRVDVCLLSPEDAQRAQAVKDWRQQLRAAAALPGPAGHGGLLQLVGQALGGPQGSGDYLGGNWNWQELDVEKSKEHPVVIAPGSSGLVRLSWSGKKRRNARLRLGVTLWAQPEGNRKARKQVPLEATVAFVPMVQFDRDRIVVKPEDWDDAGEAVVEFTCWSPTRTSFPLRAWDSDSDPCVEVAKPEPLTGGECRQLEKDQPGPPSHVLSGYRVRVILHQSRRVGGVTRDMERGQFERWVSLRSDKGTAQAQVRIRGFIRESDVVVGDEKDMGVIRLGSFKAARGKSPVRVPVITAPGVRLDRKNVQVVFQGKTHTLRFTGKEVLQAGSLEIALTEVPGAADGQGWQMKVGVPPGKPASWPDDCAIILHTKKGGGKTARRIRIPVRANPFQ
jgi:hypothetical protein